MVRARGGLEDIFEGQRLPRVGLVLVTDDVARLYELWVGVGGEGIVLKEPGSIYQPGIRTTAWLKLKPKLTLDVEVVGGSSEPIHWGDWGLAVELQLRYRHPRDGSLVEIEQAVRVRRDEVFKLHVGQHAEVVCWGVMPSGMLRHPLLLRWIA